MAAATVIYLRRKVTNGVAMVLAGAAALFGLFWLVWILWTTVSKGVANLNLDLFTMMTPPPEERGGLANAFFGSSVISLLAISIGTLYQKRFCGGVDLRASTAVQFGACAVAGADAAAHRQSAAVAH